MQRHCEPFTAKQSRNLQGKSTIFFGLLQYVITLIIFANVNFIKAILMNRLLQSILLLCSLGLFVSCEPPLEAFPELPPKTQSGEKTFACLVNNDLVVAWYETGYYSGEKRANAAAQYNQSKDQLEIYAECQFGQQFIFLISHPYTRDNVSIDFVRYLPPNSGQWREAMYAGLLDLTRIDDVRKVGSGIVSGTFSFNLEESGKPVIRVTKGRFDLILHPISYFE
jgi:hypothetical protein